MSKPKKIPGRPTKQGNMRYRIQFDFEYHGTPGKEPEGESLTEPDMTLTIGQLLENHTRGNELPEKPHIYFETEVPTIRDWTDVEKYKEQLERRLDEVTKFVEDEIEQAKAEKEAGESDDSDASAKAEGPSEPSEEKTNDNEPKA